jgi:hypothetical protein
MKIQIRDIGDPYARAEVVGRLGRLIGAAYAAFNSDAPPEGMVSDTHQQFLEEVRSIFAALLGSYPTPEEMSRMGAQ